MVVDQLNRISEFSRVRVRAHPNPKYSNHFEEYRPLLTAEISNPHQEDIQYFIDRCSLMAGHFSSALVQARLREREVVYLLDSYLASLCEYHEYYQHVRSIDLRNLEDFVSAKTNSAVSI